ncbi:YegP family protein [Streptomyces decoyicus]|uniref:YegP family protein n=1 Tax=Streptomyces decoyicus TaxID=249567 RepID=UPI00386D1FDE|nr:YegP family protein [Streptomyces decoyicus]
MASEWPQVWFTLERAGAGKFRFNIISMASENILARSVTYDSKSAAMAAIDEIQPNADVDDLTSSRSIGYKAPAKKATSKMTARKATSKRSAAKKSSGKKSSPE